LIELGVQLAIITALILPVLTVCIVIMLQPLLSKRYTQGVRKYLSYLFRAPEITPLEGQSEAQLDPLERRTNLKNQLLVRLGFIYLFVSIFIISNIIAQFYLTADDLLQTVSQEGTDLVRTWVSITIYGPFVGGWKGSLPWYGVSALPPLDGSTFHEVGFHLPKQSLVIQAFLVRHSHFCLLQQFLRR
jgi:hypothetical protein